MPIIKDNESSKCLFTVATVADISAFGICHGFSQVGPKITIKQFQAAGGTKYLEKNVKNAIAYSSFALEIHRFVSLRSYE